MKQTMAVYDLDPCYADRFADFVNQKEKVPFAVMAFTSLEALREYGKTHRIAILLVGSSIAEEELETIPADRVIRLADGKGSAPKTSGTQVYKYQSTHSIIREVIGYYCEDSEAVVTPDWGNRARIIGVYSPIGGCGKTSFAWTLGQQLGKEGKTLFLSLEEYSGFSQMVQGEGSGDFADVMFSFRQGAYNGVRFGSMIQNRGSLDYIPPVRYPEDLCQMNGEETAVLLQKIAEESHYEAMVVDVGNRGRSALPILEACSAIYMPVKEDPVSVARLEEFDTYLEVSGHSELKERIKRLRLPKTPIVARGEDYLEQLLWGELGDYVRQLLKGGARV